MRGLMMHQRLAWFAVARLLTIAITILVITPRAACAEGRTEGTVTFVTAKTIYVDLGKDDGVREGAELDVARNGVRISTLLVTSLASHSAACTMLEDSAAIRAGDIVTIVRVPSAPALAPPGSALSAPSPEADATSAVQRRRPSGSFLKQQGLRGRFALRFTGSSNLSENGDDYTQPAIDLRVRGSRIAGTAWGAEVDVRMRRTYRTLSNGDSPQSSRSRVYRLSASRAWDRHGTEVTLGRQTSASLAAVSVFDGVLGRKEWARWKTGLFAGTQPGARDYGLSQDIREFGGFVEYGRKPTRGRSLSITVGAIGSYGESDINREYLFLQNRVRRDRLSFSLSQQVDINRGWRHEAEDRRLSFTNTYASLRFSITRALTLESGFDNRRAVRLYRHMITPETDFDDSYRQGAWGGVTHRLGTRFRTSLRHRVRSGGSAGEARSTDWTAGLNLRELSGLSLRTRATVYDNGRGNGRLLTGTLGVSLGSRTTVSGTRGERREDPTETNPEERRLTWTTAEVAMNLPARCYLTLSADWTRGNGEDSRVIHGSTSYRF